jgi:hypothetical protein
MKFSLLFVFACVLVAVANAKCPTTSTTTTGSIKVEVKCSAGDSCAIDSSTIRVCGADDMYCNSSDSKCTKKAAIGATCSSSSNCLIDEGEDITCSSSKCTEWYYKSAGDACTTENECSYAEGTISTVCTAGKCESVASGAACSDSRQCVDGLWCNFGTATTRSCGARIAAGADCRSGDVCAAGYSCSATTTTSGKCVEWFSVAKGAQCSALNLFNCADGLTCDLTTNTCIDSPTGGNDCGTAVCPTNQYCNIDNDCVCAGQKNVKSGDLNSAIKSFQECLDTNKCNVRNTNPSGCGGKCASQWEKLSKEVEDYDGESYGASTSLAEGWVLSGTSADACDSASTVAASFLLIAFLAIFNLF